MNALVKLVQELVEEWEQAPAGEWEQALVLGLVTAVGDRAKDWVLEQESLAEAGD